MELSHHLRQYSRNIKGKEQTIMTALAKAFEMIPRQLCHNAGLNATAILSELREKHAHGNLWHGVDVFSGCVSNNMDKCVWEPAFAKKNALTAAIEAATVVLSIDETIKNSKSQAQMPQMPGR